MKDYTGILTTPFTAGAARREELARFLRARREALAPQRPGGRRRTPGLRREEVAAEAGISVTWYTWLEQARDVSVSAETLRRVARALQLNETEEHYLTGLARPGDFRAASPEKVPEALLTIVQGLSPHPAYAMDRVFNVVAWNDPAETLFGAFTTGDPVTGNVLARLFLDPEWKRLFVDWPGIARSAVAQFRTATAAFAQDPEVTGLVARLCDEAPVFATVWQAAELAPSPDWTKVIRRGNRTESWRYSVLRPEGAAKGFTVTLYLPLTRPEGPAAT
ncbi:helix-turn-helix transcriptional regulator [Pseudooceanicola sp. C21-150M6]|uniref:helix-turn-helix transcriptional regulator n=1 Tax=Pseudooceanicola sp. C21-150M6 TaxID=3434355 RepID=UPI003D7F9AC5